jgi:hypothetical protein
MRNVFLYWVGKDYKVIRRLRNLIYMHSMFGTAYTVHLIDDKNVLTYIHDLPPSFSKLKPAHQADYVRVYTVCKYGGIWLDADTIVMESLDPLFKLLEESDGFFIRQNNEGLCNGVFGSRAGTTVMTKWLAAIDARLNDTTTNTKKMDFLELGATFLNKTLKKSPQDFRNYTLFNGLDNMYPVNWDKCLEEYVEKPYENYKTLVRPFQPLVVLVNSVYTKLESKTDREIDEAQIPLNYFLNKSYSNGLKAYAFLVLLIGCALAFLAFVAFLVYAYTMDPVGRPLVAKLPRGKKRV